MIRSVASSRIAVAVRNSRFFRQSRNFGVVPFKLADIGEGIAEVELMKWYIAKGDKIKAFDRICEVQSDKATVDITSPFDGIIENILHKEGDIVKVGATLVDITTSAATTVASTPTPSATKPAPAKPTPTSSNASSATSITPFLLADIGEGIAEVELMKWFVKEGDSVKAFDRICEVQSDKATVEITSRYDGIIAAVHHGEGSIVKVGEALVDIKTASSSAPKLSTADHSPHLSIPPAATSPTATPPACTSSGKVLTTPAVRKIAKENNINLSHVPGTGPKGRILKEDILAYIKNPTASSKPTPASKASTPIPSPSPSTATPMAGDVKVPVRGVQRLMVKSMTAALQVPHLTYCDEMTMDALVELRAALKQMAEKKHIKLSYLPFMMKAASLALRHYPQLNATVNADVTEVTHHASHNIGLAMDTPTGLVVPVVRDVQNKSIFEIAADLHALQTAAATKSLTEKHLSGGTFTLSNIGSVGGTYMSPIIVTPQVVIGAFGRFQVVPRYVDAQGKPARNDDIFSGAAKVAPTTIMNASWAADHRVVDGATVARFSNQMKAYLENPSAMLAELR